MNNKRWKLNVSDWKKIPVETADLIFREGKEMLNYTLDQSFKITTKSFTFILIHISAISAITGYTLKIIDAETLEKNILIINIVFEILIFLLLLLFVKINFPRTIKAPGRLPEVICKEEFLLQNKLIKQEINLYFITAEIQHVNNKIISNLDSISKRIILLKIGIISSCIIFFAYFVLILVLKFI